MTTARVSSVGPISSQARRVWWGSIDSRSGADGAGDSVPVTGSVVSVDMSPPGRPDLMWGLGGAAGVPAAPPLAQPGTAYPVELAVSMASDMFFNAVSTSVSPFIAA